MHPFIEHNRGPIYLLLAIASAVGLYLFYARLPRPEPVVIIDATATAAPATATAIPPGLTVHVVGAVTRPGVYRLGGDARVIDAVNAAGGMSANADTEAINLADRLSDGQQVRVPALDESAGPTLTPYPQTAQRSGGLDTGAPAGGPVNINTATAGELETLPGIGPVLAERIIAYRTANGPFASVEQIEDVSGIGDAIFGQIRDRITVQ